MANGINLNSVTTTASKGAEMASQDGTGIASFGILFAIAIVFLVCFGSVIAYLIWQNKSADKRQDRLFDNLTKKYEDNHNTIMTLSSNIMEMRNETKLDLQYIKSDFNHKIMQVENRMLDLKTAMIDTKELDSKVFGELTSLVIKNTIQNIEKELYQMIDRNSLCELSHIIVGEYDKINQVHRGRILVIIEKNFMDGRTIIDTFRYSQVVKSEIYNNLDIVSKQVNEELCKLFSDVCKDYDAKELRKRVSDIADNFETQSQMILKGTLILRK